MLSTRSWGSTRCSAPTRPEDWPRFAALFQELSRKSSSWPSDLERVRGCDMSRISNARGRRSAPRRSRATGTDRRRLSGTRTFPDGPYPRSACASSDHAGTSIVTKLSCRRYIQPRVRNGETSSRSMSSTAACRLASARANEPFHLRHATPACRHRRHAAATAIARCSGSRRCRWVASREAWCSLWPNLLFTRRGSACRIPMDCLLATQLDPACQ
jgi:hypothetical protein